MKSRATFDTVQRWLQSVIEHPGDDHAAWNSPEAVREMPAPMAANEVLASSRLSAIERVAIYRRLFRIRTLEALEIDFPGTRAWLGDEDFRDLAAAYVRECPSKSYTLNEIGRCLPEYLMRSGRSDHAFLAELARLEWAIDMAAQAVLMPALTGEHLKGMSEHDLETLRMTPQPEVTLLRFRYPTAKALRALLDGRDVERPLTATPTNVLVYQKELDGWFREIPGDEAEVLSGLMAGDTMGAVLQAAQERQRADVGDWLLKVEGWFTTWVEDGLFAAPDRTQVDQQKGIL